LAAGNLEPRCGLATASRRRKPPHSSASAALPTIPITARTAAPPRCCSDCTTLNASSAVSEARFRSPPSGEPACLNVRQRQRRLFSPPTFVLLASESASDCWRGLAVHRAARREDSLRPSTGAACALRRAHFPCG